MQVWPKLAISHSDDACSVLISCVLMRGQNAVPATFMLDETQLVRSRTPRSREKMSSVQYSCKLFPYSIEMNQHPLREHQRAYGFCNMLVATRYVYRNMSCSAKVTEKDGSPGLWIRTTDSPLSPKWWVSLETSPYTQLKFISTTRNILHSHRILRLLSTE